MSRETSPFDQTVYQFDSFQLLPGEQKLLHEGRPVPLTYKAFRTLHMLLANRGHLLDKGEIMSAVWNDSAIEEGNLAVTISMIRKALGDTARPPKYIETVIKRGYRFLDPLPQPREDAV